MSSPTFTGSLTAKKKAELQEISQALGISDTGMREELHQRVKKHLEDNAGDLQDDPAFAGLYTRSMRQRSLQPQTSHGSLTSQKPVSTRASMGTIREQREVTPGGDMRDVSMMLPRAPLSPGSPTPSPSRKTMSGQLATPSSLPPLPSSPAKSILEDALAQPEVQAVVEMERNVVRSSAQMLNQARTLLSNGRNIFIITALIDFLSILVSINKDGPYPIPPITVQAAPALHAMSMAISCWVGPAVIVPAIIGYLVSFTTSDPAGFDPLSASITRVAANVAYEFPYLRLTDSDGQQTGEGLKSLDVLGYKWRVLTASVTLAFAFAEAIGKVGRSRNAQMSSAAPSRAFTPSR